MDRTAPRWHPTSILAGVWLLVAAVVSAIDLLSAGFAPPWYISAYLAVTVLASGFTFFAYGVDKSRARREGARRIPERSLHVMSLCGGWPGAILGQQVFRHKTQKASFRAVLWLIVAVHAACIILVVHWLLTRDVPSA